MVTGKLLEIQNELMIINGKNIYFKGKEFTREDAILLVKNIIDMYNLKLVVGYG